MNAPFSAALSFLMALLLLCSCSPSGRRPSGSELPDRAGPAYVQWLEEQACLRRSAELTAVVSGSSLNWKNSSGDTPFPDAARTWFRASPVLTAWSGHDSFLKALGEGTRLRQLAELGVQGIFLSGTADTGDEWAGRSPARGLGEDGVSFAFGRLTGTEEDYARLLGGLSEAGLLAGGTLLPANTGMGPDFFLAERSVRDYPGLYAMIETDPQDWPLLPELGRDETAPLSDRAEKALAARGVIPGALVQDDPSFFSAPCGWAVTGPVAGVDGVKRRWAYRWYLTPDRPVLHWDDPSGAARRILEASLIQQAGLRHQALVGAGIGAWIGLDPSPAEKSPRTGRKLEPGYSALRDLVRNTHRYGAALLVQDDIPMNNLRLILRTGADFAFDSVLTPALERSLLEGSASSVRSALRRALELGIDQKRLWRSTADGLPRPSLNAVVPLLPDGWPELLVPADAPRQGPRLNAATLAAVAAGLAPGEKPDADQRRRIRDGHLLQIATRAFLPGLLMLSGQDLDGGIPDGRDSHATPPIWQMNPGPSSRQGLPSGLAVYRNDPEADMKPLLQRLLAARTSTRIAEGELTAVPSCGDTVLFTLSSLPDGGHLAFFGNFSQKKTRLSPSHELWKRASSRLDPVSGESVAPDGPVLPPWGWKVVLLR